MTEEERGALVAKGFFGLCVQLRFYFTGLLVVFALKMTLVVLNFSGLVTLNRFVLIFIIMVLLFELYIIVFALRFLKRNVTPRLGMLWSGELDWDLYENGILTKEYSRAGAGGVQTHFLPFKSISRAMVFPKGQAVAEVFELYKDRMHEKEPEKPKSAATLDRQISSVLSSRIWFLGPDGKLLDVSMVQNHFGRGARERFQKLLQEKVKAGK